MDATHRYFCWLRYYGGVNLDPDNKYNLLLKRLYERPFMVKLTNDSNRVYEALEIRNEYRTYELETDMDRRIFDNLKNVKVGDHVSFLELLVSLAIRGDDMTDNPDKDIFFWFWNMVTSTELAIMTDDCYFDYGGDKYVDHVLQKINTRTFNRDGKGSFFPVRHTRVDQRKVELWYQMCALIENEGW